MDFKNKRIAFLALVFLGMVVTEKYVAAMNRKQQQVVTRYSDGDEELMPFWEVCCSGKKDQVSAFLDMDENKEMIKARINNPGSGGNTLLHVVCARGDHQVAGVVRDLGADPLLPNHNGQTALEVACEMDRLDMAGMLVEKMSPGWVNTFRGHETPFHGACRRGCEAYFKFLFHHGADPEVKTKQSRLGGWNHTAGHILCNYGHLKLLKLLVEYCRKSGGNLQAMLEAKDNTNWTLLLMAAYCKYEGICRYLVSIGANLRAVGLDDQNDPRDGVLWLTQKVSRNFKVSSEVIARQGAFFQRALCWDDLKNGTIKSNAQEVKKHLEAMRDDSDGLLSVWLRPGMVEFIIKEIGDDNKLCDEILGKMAAAAGKMPYDYNDAAWLVRLLGSFANGFELVFMENATLEFRKIVNGRKVQEKLFRLLQQNKVHDATFEVDDFGFYGGEMTKKVKRMSE
jgi:ankyrin repeat protein